MRSLVIVWSLGSSRLSSSLITCLSPTPNSVCRLRTAFYRGPLPGMNPRVRLCPCSDPGCPYFLTALLSCSYHMKGNFYHSKSNDWKIKYSTQRQAHYPQSSRNFICFLASAWSHPHWHPQIHPWLEGLLPKTLLLNYCLSQEEAHRSQSWKCGNGLHSTVILLIQTIGLNVSPQVSSFGTFGQFWGLSIFWGLPLTFFSLNLFGLLPICPNFRIDPSLKTYFH